MDIYSADYVGGNFINDSGVYDGDWCKMTFVCARCGKTTGLVVMDQEGDLCETCAIKDQKEQIKEC